MSLDLQLLGNKLTRYREQFQATLAEVSQGTGIEEAQLEHYEKGISEPSGDHILILADFYKCDYKFFLSNEKLAPFQQTETLFRMHGSELATSDRWAIQEFLFLCENEEMLLEATGSKTLAVFKFQKSGSYFKGHGASAASALRKHLQYTESEVPLDVFADFKSIGLHVFRRALENSAISGLFIRHPTAGDCVLVNYSEDIYRQRFTAAHEAGHAILDTDVDVNISFSGGDNDYLELRANTFASQYLLPPEFLRKMPDPSAWSVDQTLERANKLKISTEALSYALKEQNLIDDNIADTMRQSRVPKDAKNDPELSSSLAPGSRQRKIEMLKRGLSSSYVDLCFEGYSQGIITAGRLAEMLLTSFSNLHTVAELYGKKLKYGD